MKTPKKLLSFVLILTGMVFSTSLTLHSQDLARWTFEGNVTTPSFTEVNMIANPAVFGPGVGAVGFVTGNPGRAYTANNWFTGYFDPNDYIEFTIGPAAGYMMTLTHFTFDFKRSGTGIREWQIRTSQDGFTSISLVASVQDNDFWWTQPMFLSPMFDNLTANVTFRIYGYMAEGAAGTLRFDNVYFTGTVNEIPPPVPLSGWAIVIGLVLISTFAVIRYGRQA
jgi:hypothetical protein